MRAPARWAGGVTVAAVAWLAGCGGGAPAGAGGEGLDGCGLVAAGPRWIEEGDALRVTFSCATGAPLPEGLAVSPIPPGAVLEAGALRWRPGLDAAGDWTLEARAPSGARAAHRVGVVDRWDAEGNVPPDAARYAEEYGLPVVHLRVDGTLSADLWKPATVVYRGRTYPIQAKYRGSRSLAFPKRSIGLAFPDGDLFTDAALGFRDRKKVVLVTNFDDQSQVRDRLALELWRRLGPARIGVRTASAVVYLNDEFMGLYTLTEKVAGQVLAGHGLDGDGDLYQAKNHDANFYAVTAAGAPKTDDGPVWWHAGYEKEEGVPLQGEPGAFDDLDAFVKLVATADPAAFAGAIPDRADVDEYRDWWVLVMLGVAADCVHKNNFQYHDPATGRWRTIAWDYASSFGQDWQTLRVPATYPYAFGSGNGWFERLSAAPLDAGTRARLGTALRQRVPVGDVLALVDALAAETADVARRDERRWRAAQVAFFGAEGRTGIGTYDDEIAYLRRWIEDRWAYLTSRY